MNKEEYIKAVLHACGLPRSIRRRLRADLESDLTARLEQGKTMEQIIAAMGTPDRLASELRESWAPRPRSRREKRLLIICFLLALLLAGSLLWYFAQQSFLSLLVSALTGQATNIPPSADLGVIGGADGPTAVFVTSGSSPWLFFVFWGLLAAGLAVCLLVYRRWRSNR